MMHGKCRQWEFLMGANYQNDRPTCDGDLHHDKVLPKQYHHHRVCSAKMDEHRRVTQDSNHGIHSNCRATEKKIFIIRKVL